jgi:hypothetical protein
MACGIEDRGCKGRDAGDTLTVTGCPPGSTYLIQLNMQSMGIKGLIAVKKGHARRCQGFAFLPGQPGKKDFACCSSMQRERRTDAGKRSQVMGTVDHLNDHACCLVPYMQFRVLFRLCVEPLQMLKSLSTYIDAFGYQHSQAQKRHAETKTLSILHE